KIWPMKLKVCREVESRHQTRIRMTSTKPRRMRVRFGSEGNSLAADCITVVRERSSSRSMREGVTTKLRARFSGRQNQLSLKTRADRETAAGPGRLQLRDSRRSAPRDS